MGIKQMIKIQKNKRINKAKRLKDVNKISRIDW